MSAWTKFATQFFHQKQKQNPDYKFSQALKQASPLFKKMKKGGSRKQQGGGQDKKYEIKDGKKVECVEYSIDNGTINPNCKDENEIEKELNGKSLESAEGEVVVPGAVVPGAEVPGAEVPGAEVPGAVVPGAEGEGEQDAGKKGGKKSKRKSNKAGKKSQKKQKKAKKAGSKKSKK